MNGYVWDRTIRHTDAVHYCSCRCQYRCLSKRAKEEGGDFIKELGCCMCGMGVMRLQTGVKPKDIIYMNKENKVRRHY